jgi:hypothetical protein
MKVYLVGGAVRDELLGISGADRDWVVVGATPQDLLNMGYQAVGKDFPVFLHPQTKEEYALARTERKIAKGYHGFEVHASPDVTLEEDLSRRDLTINAMARDADLDQDLRGHGIGVLIAGLAGGLVGYTSVSRSIALVKAGARTRFAGFAAGLMVLAVSLKGALIVEIVPTPILGGLLLWLLRLLPAAEWPLPSAPQLRQLLLVVALVCPADPAAAAQPGMAMAMPIHSQ